MTYIRNATLLLVGLTCLTSLAEEVPSFVEQVVDANVKIGYGIALEDVDGDGKADIILADKKQFVWYRNPKWERFVIAENLTEKDNVCLAARDIDGDGCAEIAVGAEWNPGDTVNSGAVFYLIPPKDRTQKWTSVRLHHEPVVHRMRWVKESADKHVLVVAPLHGRGNKSGMGVGARLLAYTMPADPNEKWMTTVLDDTMHVTHNFDRGQWIGNDETPEEILYLGKEGAKLIQFSDGGWKSEAIDKIEGGGEIRGVKRADGSQHLIATIQPFHGDRLVIKNVAKQVSTTVDAELNQGHAIAVGEFVSGNNDPEVIYGWRGKNAEGVFGVRMAYFDGKAWNRHWIDQNGMACEDLRVADLDGDGRDDIVASGRSTHNLKIYWNRGAK